MATTKRQRHVRKNAMPNQTVIGLQQTQFKRKSNPWKCVVDAFSSPHCPRGDSLYRSVSTGRAIEHSLGGDFPVAVENVVPKAMEPPSKKLTALKMENQQLKAANELLRRFQEEIDNPRLRLLRLLRHEASEFVLKTLSSQLTIRLDKVAIDVAALGLLLELSQSGYVEIAESVVSVTESGKEFMRTKLLLQLGHAA